MSLYPKHKTFISYHHGNPFLNDGEQDLKDELVNRYGKDNFIDKSVSDGDINPNISEDVIMRKIREEFLYDATVLIVLVGNDTAQRKYVNSEIQAALRTGSTNGDTNIIAVVRDELFDRIFYEDVDTCGHRVIREKPSYNYYMPYLIRANDEFSGDGCHYDMVEDVFAGVVKYSKFINNIDRYLDITYQKRNKDFKINKLNPESVPKI